MGRFVKQLTVRFKPGLFVSDISMVKVIRLVGPIMFIKPQA